MYILLSRVHTTREQAILAIFPSFNEIIETLLVLSSISFIVMTTGVDALWGIK